MITAIVIAQNEERHIAECLRALAWADARLVVDGGSTDRTVELAQDAGATVLTRPFDTFARQRNFALDQATTEWVLFVDADERIEPALADEIIATAKSVDIVGFWVPRRNLMLGQWVRGGGWWPDEQLRLLRRGHAHYDESQDPHEVVVLDGTEGRLQTPIVHYNYDSIREIFARQSRYALREATTLQAHGERARRRSLISQPAREFWRRYVSLGGWRDGPLGLLLAIAMAWSRVQVTRALRTQSGNPRTTRVE